MLKKQAKNAFWLTLISLCFPGTVSVGEMLRNETAFVLDVQRHMDFDPASLYLLMETTLPNNNLLVSQVHPHYVSTYSTYFKCVSKHLVIALASLKTPWIAQNLQWCTQVPKFLRKQCRTRSMFSYFMVARSVCRLSGSAGPLWSLYEKYFYSLKTVPYFPFLN